MVKLNGSKTNKYFLMLFIILGIMWKGAVLSAYGIENPEYTITVKGEGDVRVTPDIAYVSLGVEINAPTAVEAQKENARLMNQLFSKLQSLGIKREVMKTVQFYLWRTTDYQAEQEFSSGFQIRHLVEVPLTDINQIGKIIDESINAGANVVENIYFTTKDFQKAYEQAMEMAIGNALTKAKAIAKLTGFKIISIQKISESTLVEPGFGAEGVSKEEAITPVMPGQLKVQAFIDVTYLVAIK